MDARPQRPRGLQPLADENVPPVIVPTGHFRNKSIGTSTIMGGLNAAAKRTAFADVSNTAKNKAATTQIYGKNVPRNENAASGPPGGAGKDAFRRPAQRPAKPLAVVDSNQNRVASIREPTIQSSIDQTSKTNVMVYNDRAGVQTNVENPSNQIKPPTSAASIHAIRQYKSQPQLKPEPPVLRRTQSRFLGEPSDRQEQALATMGELTEALYEDALEHIVDHEEDSEQAVGSGGVALSAEAAVASCLPAATVDPASLNQREKQQPATIDPAVLYQEEKQQPSTVDPAVLYQEEKQQPSTVDPAVLYPEEKQLPSTVDPAVLNQEEKQPPTSATVLSEPGEYWDEEEEEEVYDDQGYTTAHSIRSRGDLTTGGVTTLPFPKVTSKTISELEAATAYVEATRLPFDMAEDVQDLSMAAEYSEDIFQYMREMENTLLPNPHYMDIQTEIQWSMRSVLMDWIVQVHQRFSLLPETLFLAVNYVDRFLSCKVVSLGKLQLVGATAILLAAKYEEINCPSLQEIVYMVDRGYSMEEVMKAERFMLTMLQWELGWPGPMSFLRRISKADDYDHEVRTLAKYLIEVTIMDERFVGSPASFIAAGAHCLSRLLLRRGTWSPAHVYYSGYTWGQLKDLVSMILDCCQVPHQHHAAIFEKYDDKRFKYCSEFVQEEIQAGFTLSSCSAYDPFFTQAKREGAGYSIDAASCNIDYLRATEE